MKNILVTACYEVENMYSAGNEVRKEDYKKITWECCKSFNWNLKNLDEVIVLTGHTETYHELFQLVYYRIKEIYFSNKPCNILWTDSDNICLRPLDVFGQFDKFCMFLSLQQYQDSWMNDGSRELAKDLTPWMMANLRYYPADMPKLLWDVGDDLAYNWIEDWAYECIIYNKMFHSQGIEDFSVYQRPAWNRQAEGPIGQISPEMVRDSTIIHCHTTRDSTIVMDKFNRALQFLSQEGN